MVKLHPGNSKKFGADGGSRTPTPLRAPDFESSASANSATSAPLTVLAYTFPSGCKSLSRALSRGQNCQAGQLKPPGRATQLKQDRTACRIWFARVSIHGSAFFWQQAQGLRPDLSVHRVRTSDASGRTRLPIRQALVGQNEIDLGNGSHLASITRFSANQGASNGADRLGSCAVRQSGLPLNLRV